MSDPYSIIGVPTTKGTKMDEFDFFTDEDDFEMWGDEDYLAEEEEEFSFAVDHEAVYDCDPYDVESYHAEAMLAYYD